MREYQETPFSDEEAAARQEAAPQLDLHAMLAELREDLPSGAPPPPISRGDSWEHQRNAFAFARDKRGAMLAMGMGTGKSKVVVDLLQNDEAAERVLITCPKAVIPTWPSQFARWANYEWKICCLDKGTSKKKQEAAREALIWQRANRGRLAIVVNYESVWRPAIANILRAVQWDCIVADESHKIKAPGGKASFFLGRLAKQARRRLCLTGTPIPHSPIDIYPQYRFADRSVFDTTAAGFRARYAIPDPVYPSRIIKWINLDDLRRRFQSIAFQCATEDVLDLPEAIHSVKLFSLSPKAAKAYAQLHASLEAEFEEGKVTPTTALVRLLRMQQLTSGWIRLDDADELTPVDSGKLEVLVELAEDIEHSEPVVVFCRFRSDIETVKEAARKSGRAFGELSGSRSDMAGNILPERIHGETGYLFAVQIQSGGAGIDLTRSCYCVYFSVGYSFGDYSQSLARILRPGQERAVRYFHIMASRTIDVDLYRMLNRKDAAISELTGHRTASSLDHILTNVVRPPSPKEVIRRMETGVSMDFRE